MKNFKNIFEGILIAIIIVITIGFGIAVFSNIETSVHIPNDCVSIQHNHPLW